MKHEDEYRNSLEPSEPSAREVNKRIREENKAAKRADMSRVRSVGAGMGILARVQKRHPNDPKKQLAMFLEEFVITAGTGRKRPVSANTSSSYGDKLMQVIDDLRMDRAPIQNLGELGKTHVIRLVKYWLQKGLSPKTVQIRVSVMRRFLTFIGKEDAVPRGAAFRDWLNEKGVEVPVWAPSVATVSKAWDENGVDSISVIKKMEETCIWTATQLEVQAAFGLRMKESLMLNPKAAAYGDVLRVIHGTKGGLPRDVRFDEDTNVRAWQRDVLERAKVLASQNRKGILTIPGKSLAKAIRYFYYRVEAAGITKKELGVTAHGLRHQYIARRYEARTGMPPPVSNRAPVSYTPEQIEADHQARVEGSLDAGHLRYGVIGGYASTIRQRVASCERRVREWTDRTEGNPDFQRAMQEAGVDRAWLGGCFADGREPAPHEKLRLYIQAAGRPELDSETRMVLLARLRDMYARGVDMSDLKPGDDDGSLHELVLS